MDFNSKYCYCKLVKNNLLNTLLLESHTCIIEVVILYQNKKIHIILDVIKHDTNALESSIS